MPRRSRTTQPCRSNCADPSGRRHKSSWPAVSSPVLQAWAKKDKANLLPLWGGARLLGPAPVMQAGAKKDTANLLAVWEASLLAEHVQDGVDHTAVGPQA